MANEKRLIDANYLMKAIRERTTGSGDNFDIIMTHLYGIVEAVPTVDAVEVVRCKDCKHYVWDEFDGAYVCISICKYVKQEFWCANGERKDKC